MRPYGYGGWVEEWFGYFTVEIGWGVSPYGCGGGVEEVDRVRVEIGLGSVFG